uniref:Uncharacterized protein n=1 Tax=Cercocebus atys TaxID=9531 RepID=A0A2K5KWI6_CERAT
MVSPHLCVMYQLLHRSPAHVSRALRNTLSQDSVCPESEHTRNTLGVKEAICSSKHKILASNIS